MFPLLIISKLASVAITGSNYSANLNQKKLSTKTDNKNHDKKFHQHSLLYSLEPVPNSNKE